ncbi:MAG: hypothetical protein K1W39_12875 [Lachnospiraceae bacterium]
MKQRISKKNECNKDTKQLVEKIANEYKLFYYSMMEKDKNEIFESCNKIKFYICVSEYFEWKEDIDKKHVEALKNIIHPLEALWQYYLDHEYIRASTWEDIDELLACYSDRLCADILSAGIPE